MHFCIVTIEKYLTLHTNCNFYASIKQIVKTLQPLECLTQFFKTFINKQFLQHTVQFYFSAVRQLKMFLLGRIFTSLAVIKSEQASDPRVLTFYP